MNVIGYTKAGFYFTPSHFHTHIIISILHHDYHMPSFTTSLKLTNKRTWDSIQNGSIKCLLLWKSTESGISLVPTGLIVLGLSLWLGRGCLADSGELVDREDFLCWTVVLCFICALDDVLWSQLSGRNNVNKEEVKAHPASISITECVINKIYLFI